jgi:hypothetical protein
MDIWADHFEWNPMFTELIPKTPIGKITIKLLQMNRLQIMFAREMWVEVGRHPPKNL